MGPYERRSGAVSVEQRGPAVCSFSGRQEGKDEMTKASVIKFGSTKDMSSLGLLIRAGHFGEESS